MAGAIKFIDELLPNGKTYALVDQRNIRGGVHYADTIEEMNNIHESRIVHGILCHVKEDNNYYTYDFDAKKWVVAKFSEDDFFVCTLNSVKDTDMSSTNKIGNLPLMTKADLEKLTINEILTRALFKEEIPFFTSKAPTVNSLTQEVGTTILGSSFKITNGTYSYGYIDGKTSNGTIEDSGNTRVLNFNTAKFGTSACCTLNTVTNPNIPYTGTDLKTSWNRTYDEYAKDNNTTVTAITINNTYKVTANVTGYYIIQYGILNQGKMITLENDVKSGIDHITLSLPNEPRTGQITSVSTEIYIGTKNNTTGLPSSAFVYVAVPLGYKIASAAMLNGLNFKYEALPTNRYNKLATAIPSLALFCTIPKRDNAGNTLYSYDIWYIAKGDANGAGEVSPTAAPLMIKLAKA